MATLKIHSLMVKQNRLFCRLSIPYNLRHCFISDAFFAEYDEDISSCPESILIIPAVMNIAPIAWASNTLLSVPVLDELFYYSLTSVRSGYAKLYPSVFDNNSPPIISRAIISSKVNDTTAPGILFSGGVDSVSSTISILNSKPALITINGSDICLSNQKSWLNVHNQAKYFANPLGLSTHSITSNFREILRYYFLDSFCEKIGRGWWGAVHYGTALPGLCAPIAYNHGYSHIFLSSGITKEDIVYPEARPIFVNELKWSGTNVLVIDSETKRQDKLIRISNYIEQTGALPKIRSCLQSADGTNCSTCEKCSRTIVGLILANTDPNLVGYSVDLDTLPRIKCAIEKNLFHFTTAETAFWKDMQQYVVASKPYLFDEHGFFKWFISANLEDYSKKNGSVNIMNIVKKIIYHLPYPVNLIVYKACKVAAQLYPFIKHQKQPF